MNRRIETSICFVVLMSIALTAGAAPNQDPGEASTWIDVEQPLSASGAGNAAAAAPPVVEVREDASRIDISFTISGYSREIVEVQENNYTRLSLPGTGLSGEDGHPALPFKGLFVEIPYGVEVVPRLLESETELRTVPSPVLPMQPTVPESVATPPFTIDAKAYESGGFLPRNLVEVAQVGFIRGARVAFLRIYPIQYSPTTGELIIHKRMNLSLSFKGEVDPSGVEQKRRLSSGEFDSLSRRLIENYREVGAERTTHGSSAGTLDTAQPSPESAGKTSFVTEATAAAEVGPQIDATGADYLIIVADSLLDDCNLLDDFIDWKTMKGYIVAVERMSDVGTSSTDIARYIWDAYHLWDPAPTYVLLLGNAEDVPSRLVEAMAFYSDHEYTLTDGSDDWPDLHLGRIFADDGTNHCDAALGKIINYDRDPDTVGDWYDTTALLSYFQDDDTDCTADRWFADITGDIHNYMETIKRGLELPNRTLTNLVRTDPSPAVRWLALGALADRPGVAEIAELAVQDPSLHVRSRAEEILSRLDVVVDAAGSPENRSDQEPTDRP